MLRAKTFEAATLMGVAVGKDRFRTDAIELIQVLCGSEAGGIAPDDPQTGYMLGCWSRLCQVLEDEFMPFMPSIMPGLLATAKQPPGIRQLEADDPDINPEEWAAMNIDDELIGIKTSSLEEKRGAFDVLVRFAQRLRGNFAPYVSEILAFLPGLMRFYFDEDVRVLSMEIVAYLLTACVENDGVSRVGGRGQKVKNLLFLRLITSRDSCSPVIWLCRRFVSLSRILPVPLPNSRLCLHAYRSVCLMCLCVSHRLKQGWQCCHRFLPSFRVRDTLLTLILT